MEKFGSGAYLCVKIIHNKLEGDLCSLNFQGDHMVIANLGDSRAVLYSRGDDDQLVSVQLTIDLKPNLPSKFQSLIIKLKSRKPIIMYVLSCFSIYYAITTTIRVLAEPVPKFW